MASSVKSSSSAPVFQTQSDEVSSDGPVFTLTRSSHSHVTMPSAAATDCESGTCGVDLYEPSSNNNNNWYSTKFSTTPTYVDRQPTTVDIESNSPPPAKLDSASSKHDVDLTKVFVPHMVFSCLAMWCCGCVFGCMGFLFAVASARYENQGEDRKAKVFSYISFSLSSLGFITGTVAIVLLIVYSFGLL